jgi:hypothetical protein
MKTLCGCREQRVQTKEKYKLRLTTKAYKLSYNYINYTINLVGRSFSKWRRKELAFWWLKEGEEDVVRVCSEASAVMGAVVAYFFLN